MESWTFSGATGQRIFVSAVTTSGLVNTNITLKAPGGATEATSGTVDRLDAALAATGAYTIEISDVGLNDAGTYAMTFLNLATGPLTSGADPDGGPITSSSIATGTTTVADFDAFTFSGTVNDRILFNAVATAGGGGYNTTIYLYGPTGTSATNSFGADQLDFKLTASGTWTVVVEDSGNESAGSYSVSFLNVTAGPLTNGLDLDGGPIASNEIKTGGFSTGVDMDAWTFSGASGQTVLFAALATGGGAQNTQVVLYPPAGGAAVINTASDRSEYVLNATGAWTLVVESVGNITTGSYNLCLLNATAGALPSGGDGGIVQAGVPINGTISQAGDLDGYTFHGSVGQTANISCVVNSGPMNSQITLYPPGGGAAILSTATDVVNQPLASTGYYTIVIEDNGNDQAGGYVLTLNGTGAVSGAPPDPGAEAGVELRVFNAAGALVRTLVSATLPAGRHEVAWDGRDEQGQSVGSGVYYLRMRAAGEDLRQKVVRVL